MQKNLPSFKFFPKSHPSNSTAYIEVDRKYKYEIFELTSFYKKFGYSKEVAGKAILPDDFILENYFRGSASKYKECYQMHIIEYLLVHSHQFKQQYGEQCKKWLEDLSEERKIEGELCSSCGMKTYCTLTISA